MHSVKALIQTESNATQAGVLPFLLHYVLSVYIVQRNYFKNRLLDAIGFSYYFFLFFSSVSFFSTIVDININV